MERKTKVLPGVTLRRPRSLPSWPRMWPHGHAPLLPPRALPPPLPLPHLLHLPREASGSPNQSVTRWPLGSRVGSAWRCVWRSRGTCVRVSKPSALPVVAGLRFPEGREQDVLVIIMAPVETSAVHSFCRLTPSLREIWSSLKMLLARDSDGMFEVSEEMRRGQEGEGRLRRPPSKNPLLY